MIMLALALALALLGSAGAVTVSPTVQKSFNFTGVVGSAVWGLRGRRRVSRVPPTGACRVPHERRRITSWAVKPAALLYAHPPPTNPALLAPPRQHHRGPCKLGRPAALCLLE